MRKVTVFYYNAENNEIWRKEEGVDICDIPSVNDVFKYKSLGTEVSVVARYFSESIVRVYFKRGHEDLKIDLFREAEYKV